MADTGNSITGYILARLDKITERQDELKDLIRALSQTGPTPTTGPEKPSSNLFSKLQKLPLHWQWIAGGIVSWGVSSAIGSYLKHGGDPVKLIETLLGAFVSAVS